MGSPSDHILEQAEADVYLYIRFDQLAMRPGCAALFAKCMCLRDLLNNPCSQMDVVLEW